MKASRTLNTLKPIALVLAGAMLGGFFSDMLRASPALAQSRDLPPEKILNSAEWTKRTADSVAQANERLGRIEAMLSAGIKVKVTEMPAMPKDGK
ncbi:MAG TPA: hypothetical protein PKE29_01995 [Phycisphaerales bacterium]|nr:hypothetical protein [Phycisphaerales bacterium]